MQCGLKSQLAYIYIYICAQLPSRLGMQLNLRLRSLYVLLLCLYVPYTCRYYSCNETHPAPGASTCSRWRPDELHGCCLYTSDARRIRDLDKSITSFYLASYPGLLSQLFSQPWKKRVFFHGCEKSCERRPGYEATFYPGRLTTAPTRLEFV